MLTVESGRIVFKQHLNKRFSMSSSTSSSFFFFFSLQFRTWRQRFVCVPMCLCGGGPPHPFFSRWNNVNRVAHTFIRVPRVNWTTLLCAMCCVVFTRLQCNVFYWKYSLFVCVWHFFFCFPFMPSYARLYQCLHFHSIRNVYRSSSAAFVSITRLCVVVAFCSRLIGRICWPKQSTLAKMSYFRCRIYGNVVIFVRITRASAPRQSECHSTSLQSIDLSNAFCLFSKIVSTCIPFRIESTSFGTHEVVGSTWLNQFMIFSVSHIFSASYHAFLLSSTSSRSETTK